MKAFQYNIQLAGLDEIIKMPLPVYPSHVVSTGEMRLVGRGDNAKIRPTKWVRDVSYYSATYPFELVPEWNSRKFSPEEIRGVLFQFIELAEDNQRVAKRKWLKFVGKWGYLGLCDKHGIPFPHIDHKDCMPAGWDERWGQWRHLARRTSAMVNIAMALHATDGNPDADPKSGDPGDWSAIDPSLSIEWQRSLTPESAKDYLGAALDDYIEWSRLRLRLDWTGQRARVGLLLGSLFAQITAQLLFFITSGAASATCTECGTFYVAGRKPRRDQDNYCEECKAKGVPNRNAKRRQRGGVSRKYQGRTRDREREH